MPVTPPDEVRCKVAIAELCAVYGQPPVPPCVFTATARILETFMKNHLLGAASALFLMTGGAFAAPADQPGHQGPEPRTSSESMSAVKDSTAGLVGQVSAEMTHTTKGFVEAAATSDMYEVTAAKIAEQRAESPQVKEFAEKMVKAHTETTEKLKGIIADNNIAVTPPAHVDDRRQGMLDDLRGAKAQDFDHRYISQQIAAHKEADILMRGYAKDGDNQAIKDFANTTDKAVKMHLSMAENLEATTKSASNQ
jgi:putative membrane protein